MLADLFCRVVDNYGDIGVCWRLARRLTHEGWRVRLWVDDLDAFARVQGGFQAGIPRGAQTRAQAGIQAGAARQACGGVEVIHWTADCATPEPGGVVIEAFACDPPAAFVQAMRRKPVAPVWVNLEYLSAEDWVESCHGLPSRRADGLVKYFFFPGFTAATGGLMREPGLSAERDALQGSLPARLNFLRGLGLDGDALELARRGARIVTLFCYPGAPWAELARALARLPGDTLLLALGGAAPGLEAACPAKGRLRMERVPFVAQPDFDRLLWCADLNFVRGEDSFVRAAWAARPLVWQIYPQNENAHLTKLQAWLARYPAPEAAKPLNLAWNGAAGLPLQTALETALTGPAWPAWQAAARAWDAALSSRPDLAASLIDFCVRHLQTQGN
jgi:uncharacterized repeat protein (TIGR03837 family)